MTKIRKNFATPKWDESAEPENLDELTKKTLKSYKKQAKSDLNAKVRDAFMNRQNPMSDRKTVNRARGVDLANAKLSREELEPTFKEYTRDDIDAVDPDTEIETQSPEELFTLRDMIVSAASDKPDEFKTQFDAVMQDYLQNRIADAKTTLQNSFMGVEEPVEQEGNDGEETDSTSEEK